MEFVFDEFKGFYINELNSSMHGKHVLLSVIENLLFITSSDPKYKTELIFLEKLRKLNKLLNHIICCISLGYISVYKLGKIV